MNARHRDPHGGVVGALALAATAAAFGCQLSLPQLSDSGSPADGFDAGGDALAVIADRGLAPDADSGLVDAAADAAPVAPVLQGCAPAEIVDPDFGKALSEVGLSTDGLTLYARQGSGRVVASRATREAPFGAWAPAPAWYLAVQDPAFYREGTASDPVERLLGAVSATGGRVLVDCLVGETCNASHAVEVELPPGFVGPDMDGPALADAVLDGRGLLLVFNAGLDGTGHDLLQARRTNDGRWVTEMVLPIMGDDPGISPDGRLILFHKDSDLWVASRPTVASRFEEPTVAPEPLSVAGHNDWGAYVATYPPEPDRLEIFFSSDRGGIGQVYWTTCAVSSSATSVLDAGQLQDGGP